MEEKEESLLKVGARSNSQNLAAAISHGIYDSKQVTLRAVGAGAVNQAVKAIAIAQGYVAPRGLVLYTRVGFDNVQMPDRLVSAIVFRLTTS